MSKKVLVLGANGRFGRNATAAFSQAGWETTAFDRTNDNLEHAAKGIDVIVNAWNPPYNLWAAQVPQLHAAVRKAALANDCTVIVPGNVYVFGPNTAAPWSETSHHRADNPLGKIRIDMEQAYRREGVRTIVLRAGDFLDTEASGNWFDQIMAAKIAKGRFVYPGNPAIPHAWAFLPDLCRAAVALAEIRTQLPVFSDVPYAGYALSGQDMVDVLSAATAQPVALKQFPWWQIQLARPFWPLAKHLAEMRYLWNTPHWLDGDKFRALCPDFQETPQKDALRQASACLMPSSAQKGTGAIVAAE